jgi:creatinine amidohydrolase
VLRLSQMPWREVRVAGERGAVAVLPIGSQEQHSEHLPMGTDTLLVEAALDNTAQLLDAEGPELVRLPALPFGHSPHHLFAAAVSLSDEVLLAVLTDVLDSLVRSGFRRVLVVNGHGGNEEIMRLAVKRGALRYDVAFAACSYWAVVRPDGEPEDPDRTPGHAGWFETSLMLAAHPDLVRAPAEWQEPAEAPLFDERHGEWERVRGTTDDAAAADAGVGRELLVRRARGLADAIRAFDLATRHSHAHQTGEA